MSRALEYLDEAIEEAEVAARWYAERSSTAASGFAEEIDAAIAAIEQKPEAWPLYDHGTRHYLLRRYPFSVVYRIEATRILVAAGAWTTAPWILGFAASKEAWLTRHCSRRHPRRSRAAAGRG